jgi:hypothetical protein
VPPRAPGEYARNIKCDKRSDAQQSQPDGILQLLQICMHHADCATRHRVLLERALMLLPSQCCTAQSHQINLNSHLPQLPANHLTVLRPPCTLQQPFAAHHQNEKKAHAYQSAGPAVIGPPMTALASTQLTRCSPISTYQVACLSGRQVPPLSQDPLARLTPRSPSSMHAQQWALVTAQERLPSPRIRRGRKRLARHCRTTKR